MVTGNFPLRLLLLLSKAFHTWTPTNCANCQHVLNSTPVDAWTPRNLASSLPLTPQFSPVTPPYFASLSFPPPSLLLPLSPSLLAFSSPVYLCVPCLPSSSPPPHPKQKGLVHRNWHCAIFLTHLLSPAISPKSLDTKMAPEMQSCLHTQKETPGHEMAQRPETRKQLRHLDTKMPGCLDAAWPSQDGFGGDNMLNWPLLTATGFLNQMVG